MRVICGVLFALGIPWAMIAWIFIFGLPVVVVEEYQAGRIRAVVQLVVLWPLFAGHFPLGYLVWSRWLLIALGRRRSTRRFWVVASVHHFCWLVISLIEYLQGNSLSPVIDGYAAVVFSCVCCWRPFHVQWWRRIYLTRDRISERSSFSVTASSKIGADLMGWIVAMFSDCWRAG
jgi:hypothetical protein